MSVIAKKLVIFGNGFDLWLGLPTKCSDYHLFLKNNKKKYPNCYKLFDFISAKFKINNNIDLWSDLEQNTFNFLKNIKETEIDKLVDKIKNINLIDACIEKNNSIAEWIKNIRTKYKNKFNKLTKWHEELIKNDYFLWSFNFTQNWFNPIFYSHVAEAHGYLWQYNENSSFYGDQFSYQFGASFQLLHDDENIAIMKKFSDSLEKFKKIFTDPKNKEIWGGPYNQEIRTKINEWIKSYPLFFLILFCCKHSDVSNEIQELWCSNAKKDNGEICKWCDDYNNNNRFKPSIVPVHLERDEKMTRFLISQPKQNMKNFGHTLFEKEIEKKARPIDNTSCGINERCYLPIKDWCEQGNFPNVYIFGLNIFGQDQLYFTKNNNYSPLKLALEYGKECYLSYSKQVIDDKSMKIYQYKKCLSIDDNEINKHVLEFEELAKKVFGDKLFDELEKIKNVNE